MKNHSDPLVEEEENNEQPEPVQRQEQVSAMISAPKCATCDSFLKNKNGYYCLKKQATKDIKKISEINW